MKLKPWMAALGMTEKGAVHAELFLAKYVELYEGALAAGIMDQTSAQLFLSSIEREAAFRVFELKKRDPKFAKKYLKDNR